MVEITIQDTGNSRKAEDVKQLTCEICGSTDLVKEGGVFVCQACGCKYSTEEARKMMIEGTVNIEGTVKVDNSQLVDNFLSMAQSAEDASNEQEAEDYANKALELEPTNWRALYIKGKAAGWQSGVRNNRISEAIDYFSQAIENCGDESEREELKKKISSEVSNLELAMIGLHCSNFSKFPSVDNAQDIINEAQNSLLLAVKLIVTCGTTADEFKSKAATLMNQCVVQAWKSIWNDYTDGKQIQPDGIASSYSHNLYSQPSKYDWERFYSRADACTRILTAAIALDSDDFEDDIQRYENLIFIGEQTIDSHSVAYLAGSAYVSAKWCTEYSFTEEAKAIRREQIDRWKKEKAEAEAKAKEQKVNAYWESHPEEREKIQAQIDKLEAEVETLSSSSEYIEAQKRVTEFEANKKDIETQIANCGLFNGKEKKRLREELNAHAERVAPFQTKKRSIDEEIKTNEGRIQSLRQRLIEPTGASE